MATATSRLVNRIRRRLFKEPFGNVGPLGNCEERDNVACGVLVGVIEVMKYTNGCHTGITGLQPVPALS